MSLSRKWLPIRKGYDTTTFLVILSLLSSSQMASDSEGLRQLHEGVAIPVLELQMASDSEGLRRLHYKGFCPIPDDVLQMASDSEA